MRAPAGAARASGPSRWTAAVPPARPLPPAAVSVYIRRPGRFSRAGNLRIFPAALKQAHLFEPAQRPVRASRTRSAAGGRSRRRDVWLFRSREIRRCAAAPQIGGADADGRFERDEPARFSCAWANYKQIYAYSSRGGIVTPNETHDSAVVGPARLPSSRRRWRPSAAGKDVDAAFKAFWDAARPRTRRRLVPDIVGSGVSFDEALKRLKAGRPYSAKVPKGVVTTSYADRTASSSSTR